MMRKVSILFLTTGLLVGLLSGCGDNPAKPQPVPVPPRKTVSPTVKATKAPSVAEKGMEKPAYIFDPSGRRDPFDPPMVIKRPVPQSNEPLTPLQKYDLDQLRLIGIIIGKGTPSAMIVAPDGKSYILQKGTKVGKNNGVVLRVKQESVVVQEKFYDFSGDVRKSVKEIQLPKREGV